jgi:uncharacterized Zn-finger protein
MKKTVKKFYNFVKKTKFNRPSQPGLTRYNWDSQGNYEKGIHEHSRKTHFSNAEELIWKVPPVEVSSDVVLCYGVGEMGWGHPIEYIQLNTRDPEKPTICKYCGLRYGMKQSHQ